MVTRLAATLIALVLLAAPVRSYSALPLTALAESMTNVFDPEGGWCTAFAVSLRRYVTASHCIGAPLTTTNGTAVRVIKVDRAGDLALLDIDEPRPVLDLGREPAPGDVLFQLGLGASTHGPFLYAIFSIVQNLHDSPFTIGPRMTFDGNAIPGMSGGPIVDSHNQVVSVVQGGGPDGTPVERIGVGATYDALKKLVR